jgi:hypothetical protein
MPQAVTRAIETLHNKVPGVPPIMATHGGADLSAENSETPPPVVFFRWSPIFQFVGRPACMVIRDPRDAVVSYFYQSTKRAYKPLHFTSIDEFALDPLCGFPRIVRFYKHWSKVRVMCSRFHLLRYEDMIAGSVPALRETLVFFGYEDASEELVERLYKQWAFDKMAEVERVGGAGMAAGFGSPKVRRAVVGGYRDELSGETITKLNAWMKEIPKEFL